MGNLRGLRHGLWRDSLRAWPSTCRASFPDARKSVALDRTDTLMAKLVDVGSIGCYFESLSDPRHTRNRKHLLVDIAVISVCGILCGCDGPTAIHRWAALQVDWLSQHLTLPNGIPS